MFRGHHGDHDAEDLAAGRVISLFPEAKLEVAWGYDLIYRIGNQDHPKVRAFRRWILREARDYSALTGCK